jgi:hypothetical protein
MSREGVSIQHIVLVASLFLWGLKYFAWTTPNNVLHENGLAELVGIEWVLSFVGGGILALITYRSKQGFSHQYLYLCSMLSSSTLCLFPVLLMGAAFIGVVFFGATV